ncbi:hypothetical protein [Microbacterium allomyrinae]|uniref:Uncharacterized protein n=1 Tax=Microbacterium allomyrinae TaxID=2830666 RepID=A0A9X1LYH4_9MICO|nr:hypothetical protein [Microbacterium allomyrinae]MCC2034111.1 hypothetical protein [Microbacterium allomyrinae]
MPPTEPTDVVLARVDERVRAVERDVREIKDTMMARTPQWPAIVSSLAAIAALIVTLIIAL